MKRNIVVGGMHVWVAQAHTSWLLRAVDIRLNNVLAYAPVGRLYLADFVFNAEYFLGFKFIGYVVLVYG